jgi:conjugal transfer/entry exclusion protein
MIYALFSESNTKTIKMKNTIAILALLLVPTLALAVSVNPNGQEATGAMNSEIDGGESTPSVRRLQDARQQVNKVNERAQEVENRANELQQQGQERVDEVRQEAEERQAEVENRREEVQSRVCETTELRIQNQIRRYDIIRQNHQARNQRVVTRLNEVMLRLESEGIDVSGLRESIQGLQATVDSFEVSAQDYINLLIESENFACRDSEGEFKSRLQSARDIAPQIRGNILSIREYFQAEIRPELEAIRTQLEAQRAVEQTEASTPGVPTQRNNSEDAGEVQGGSIPVTP